VLPPERQTAPQKALPSVQDAVCARIIEAGGGDRHEVRLGGFVAASSARTTTSALTTANGSH
jgi:hypothetical protein